MMKFSTESKRFSVSLRQESHFPHTTCQIRDQPISQTAQLRKCQGTGAKAEHHIAATFHPSGILLHPSFCFLETVAEAVGIAVDAVKGEHGLLVLCNRAVLTVKLTASDRESLLRVRVY